MCIPTRESSESGLSGASLRAARANPGRTPEYEYWKIPLPPSSVTLCDSRDVNGGRAVVDNRLSTTALQLVSTQTVPS